MDGRCPRPVLLLFPLPFSFRRTLCLFLSASSLHCIFISSSSFVVLSSHLFALLPYTIAICRYHRFQFSPHPFHDIDSCRYTHPHRRCSIPSLSLSMDSFSLRCHPTRCSFTPRYALHYVSSGLMLFMFSFYPPPTASVYVLGPQYAEIGRAHV